MTVIKGFIAGLVYLNIKITKRFHVNERFIAARKNQILHIKQTQRGNCYKNS